jgi:hypothetical protein
LLETHYGRICFALSVLAALLSLGYVEHYLRGGPRIIDATTYLLEARGFASGHLGLEPLPVSAAQRGRFLYFDPETRHLSALFPPGYPALLALGIRAGCPALIGAGLAALLVWATALLARRVFDSRPAALFAASLSVANACLRYHTADTMSHGLAALLVLLSLYGGLGATKRDGVIAGLALGWLFATRPATALGIGIILAVRFLCCTRAWTFLGAFVPSLLPGLGLWWLYQWSSTGDPLGSTQMAYYAVADGPRGCFRYGFGKGIGCLFEHGTYVAHRLPDGYGPWQAAYVTLLRLRWHALDVLGFELLAPLVLWAVAQALRHRDAVQEKRAFFVALAILSVIVAYVPFYFDGSYPGGGARFYADIIPLEHVLVAGVFFATSLGRWILPVSLLGFAVHGAFEHHALRERDGGRPMFEPRVLKSHGVSRGLVFVDTDHGFALGHDPAARDPKREIVVVRRHADAHDRVLWERLGRPDAYHYVFDPGQSRFTPQVWPVETRTLQTAQSFEAEAEWPPWSVSRGWVMPVYPPNDCTSARRGLALEPDAAGASVTLAVHVESPQLKRLHVAFVARERGRQQLTLSLGQLRHDVDRQADAHECFAIETASLRMTPGEHRLTIETGRLGIVLDRYWFD